MEDAVEVDVDHALPVVEREVREAFEFLESGSVHENRHRAELSANGGKRFRDLLRVRDVTGVCEVGIGRVEIDGCDVQAIGAQPSRDSQADAGAASSYDRRLHAGASAIKNRPSDYENRTLGACVPARHHWSRVRTGETFGSGLSHG